MLSLSIEQSLLEAFPNLIYCQLNERKALVDQNLAQHYQDAGKVTDFVNWIGGNDIRFEQLRMRIPNGEVIIRNMGSDQVLVIISPSSITLLVLDYLKDLPVIETEQGNTATLENVTKNPEPTPNRTGGLIQKQFFAHKSSTLDCADFIWSTNQNDCYFIGLISCSGRSADGRKTSELCGDLLYQAFEQYEPGNPKSSIKKYYELLVQYNDQAPENRKVKSEVGIFCADIKLGAVQFVSTGVSLLHQTDSQKLELIKTKRILKYESPEKYLYEYSCDIHELKKLYLYSAGVAELFGGAEHERLSHEGFKKIVEAETQFAENYYLENLHFWVGDTLQSDNISILGLQLA